MGLYEICSSTGAREHCERPLPCLGFPKTRLGERLDGHQGVEALTVGRLTDYSSADLVNVSLTT